MTINETLHLKWISCSSAERSLAVFLASSVLSILWGACARAVASQVGAYLGAAARALRGKERIHVTGMFPTTAPASKVLFTGANTTRGKCNSLFKSGVVYKTCVSDIKKCHMWCWISFFLCPRIELYQNEISCSFEPVSIATVLYTCDVQA